MKNDLLTGIAWASVLLLSSAGAVMLRNLGYIDQESVLRVTGLNGLMIAYYGNLAPKKVAPRACVGQVSRVGGWSLFLSGLLYAALWLFAPISVASTLGTGAVAAGVVVTLGYCLWARLQAEKAQPHDVA